MAFKGKTFNFQSVTAGDDGQLYNMLTNSSDLGLQISGSLAITSNVLTLGEMALVIGGRFIRVESGTSISLGSIASSETQGRVVIRLDMHQVASETTLAQVQTIVETTSGSFRALTRNNINSISGQNTGIYEAVLCTFTCSGGTASAPVLSLMSANNTGHGIYNRTSLNDCTIAGSYYINPSVTSSYIPVTSWGILEVIRTSRNDAGAVLQRFTAVNNGITYTRYDANGTGSFTGWVAEGHSITRITYTSQALTGLNATFIKQSAITLEYGSAFLAGGSVGGDYFTLPVGKYKIHTHFATNPGANGYIKSCLKLASTSTTIIMTDKALTGAGLGSNATIIGIDGEDVFTIASNTTFRFLVMTSGNVEGFSAQVIIERI